jgi:Tol biopolymer transport system component
MDRMPSIAQTRHLLGLGILVCALSALALVETRADDMDSKIHNLEKLNTPADEDDPNLAPDGLAFFFTSNSSGQFHVMMAQRRSKTQPFATAKVLDDLAGKADDVSPYLMVREQDGSDYLYFASKDPKAGNFDIFFTRRLRPLEPFQRIAIAPVQTICTDEDEMHPCLTADSKEIYFSRKTKDGWRIGHASGAARRSFEKVELLDLPVGFYHPSVTRDNLTMYVQGPAEKGQERLALFVCRRTSVKSKWSQPEALMQVNSSEGKRGDCSPSISFDGTTLYFASDRPGGKGGLDLYYIAVKDLKLK